MELNNVIYASASIVAAILSLVFVIGFILSVRKRNLEQDFNINNNSQRILHSKYILQRTHSVTESPIPVIYNRNIHLKHYLYERKKKEQYLIKHRSENIQHNQRYTILNHSHEPFDLKSR